MICYITRGSLASDVRMQKYVRACKDSNIHYFVVSWDRLLENHDEPYEYAFKRYAAYGGRSIFWNFLFALFVYWHLFTKWNKYSIIHAANFETFIFIFPFKFFGKKLVYDMYDRGVFQKLERWLCRQSDLFIIPSRYRLEQIGLQESDFKHFLEIENVPVLSGEFRQNKHRSNCIRLAYVGTFEQNIRGIENVLEFVESNKFAVLDIAGSGGCLEDYVRECARRCERIVYHGKVDYRTALTLMGNADFIMALYYVSNAPAHKYAAPNKYYESLFLRTPIITNVGTIMSKIVARYDTGYIIGESLSDLSELLFSIYKNGLNEEYYDKVSCCARLWETKYDNYIKDKLECEYLQVLLEL